MYKAICLLMLFIPLVYVLAEYFGDDVKTVVERTLTRLGS